MAKVVTNGNELQVALDEIMKEYSYKIGVGVGFAAEKAAKRLVDATKQDAPVGRRKKHYKSYIAAKKATEGRSWIWLVRKPEYRLTHLLVHGHDIKRGGAILGHATGNDFLSRNVEKVAEEFEKDVKEAIENVK